MTSFAKLVGGIYEEKIMQHMKQTLLIGLLPCLSTAYAGQVGSPNPNIYSPTNSPIQGATIAPTAANSSDSYRYLVFQEEWDAFHKNEAGYREAYQIFLQRLDKIKGACKFRSDGCQHQVAEAGAQAKILERWREAITLGIEALEGQTVEELKRRWVAVGSNTGATLSGKIDTFLKETYEFEENIRICRRLVNELTEKCRENVDSDECSRSKIAEINAQVEALAMREKSLALEWDALDMQVAEEIRLRRRKWVVGLAGAIGIAIVGLIHNRA